ncbi:MAG: alpha/beta fold hydrolase [Chloroflexi bacterium]|nr:alpha/beta fold hydrolase [Chloroflexota bacterium]
MPTIHVSGLDTYYEISGQGQALVFIHGLGSSSRDWAFQAEFFSKHFRVLAYDVRGHGQTGKAKGPYSVPMFATDLAELLKALGIEKAHLVGLSMGGWIAFQFAVDYPEMVRSLTIVNSWADMRPKNFRDRVMLFRRNVIFRFFSMRKIGEILSEGLFVKPEQAALRETFVESWAKNHKPSYMAAMRAGTSWSVADRLDRITHPTLVISADEDYTPVEAKQAYVEKLPDARLVVIDDSRHATPVERPDEFNRVLFDFLREI